MDEDYRIPTEHRALQKLAMKHGIKANQKKEIIVAELIEKLDAEEKSIKLKEDETSPPPNHDANHDATDSSSPESNTTKTSPESGSSDSPAKRVRFNIQDSARSALKTLSRVFPKSPADGRMSNSAVVQNLSLRFGSAEDSSFNPRVQVEEDSSLEDNDSGSFNDSDDNQRGNYDDAGELDRSDVVILDNEHDVVEIIDRMNRLSISVDIDGPNATDEDRATDLPPLEELGFDFPAGNLGLMLQKDEYNNTFVSEVKPSCPLRDYIIRGDILLSIDDMETRKISLEDVQKSAMNRCYYPRRLIFGRQAAKCKDPKAKSRRKGMSTSSIRGVARSFVAASSRLIPTNVEAALSHAISELKNARFSHRGLRVGAKPNKFSQIKGREVEKVKGVLCERLLKYDNMVSTPDKPWEPIIAFLGIYDPFTQSPVTGGARKYHKKHVREIPKLATLAETTKFPVVEALIQQLSECKFQSSPDLEVVKASNKEELMVALNGDRSKTAEAPEEELPPTNHLMAQTPTH